MTPNQRLATAALAEPYVDEAGRLVIDGRVVCPCCLEDLPRCECALTSTVHSELAELAAEAKAAPVLRVRLRGASWATPPPQRRQREAEEHYRIIAAELRERPGRWAIIGTYVNRRTADSTASHIRHGRRKYLNGDEFEVASRTVDGEHHVYARYVGAAC